MKEIMKQIFFVSLCFSIIIIADSLYFSSTKSITNQFFFLITFKVFRNKFVDHKIELKPINKLGWLN